MPLAVFLNILGAFVGFCAGIFFAKGAIKMTPEKIQKIAATYWDSNEHWGYSIADQRADYIAGGILLVLSFSFQLTANFVPASFEPSFLQPFSCAIAEVFAIVALLLVLAVLVRNAVATSTKLQVRQRQAEAIAQEELVNKVNGLSKK
jgi:hypothetical protein